MCLLHQLYFHGPSTPSHLRGFTGYLVTPSAWTLFVQIGWNFVVNWAQWRAFVITVENVWPPSNQRLSHLAWMLLAVTYSKMLRAHPAFCSSECNKQFEAPDGSCNNAKSWKWDEAWMSGIGAACGTRAILAGFSDRPAECQVNQPPTHWLHPSAEQLTIATSCHQARSGLRYPLFSCQLQIDSHLSLCCLCSCLCAYGSRSRVCAVAIDTWYGMEGRVVDVRVPAGLKILNRGSWIAVPTAEWVEFYITYLLASWRVVEAEIHLPGYGEVP